MRWRRPRKYRLDNCCYIKYYKYLNNSSVCVMERYKCLNSQKMGPEPRNKHNSNIFPRTDHKRSDSAMKAFVCILRERPPY